MRIRAAVVDAPGAPFSLEELELGPAAPDEVLVRVVACGLCHADLMARDQGFPIPLPIVVGHEGAGVVESVGSAVDGVAAGDRVILTFSACGRCEPCRTGRTAYCTTSFARNFGGSRPDGSSALTRAGAPVHGHFFGQSSLATHALVPAANLVRVAPDAPLELYAPLGCGVQTGAGAVMNNLAVPAGSGIAVFGVGSVGLSAVMAAHAVGVTRIVAVDVQPERLALSRELGATDALDARAVRDLADAVRSLTGGEGIPYALDTSGRPETIRAAFEALSVTGTLGLLAPGSTTNEASFRVLDLVVGRRVVGIQEGDSVPGVFIPRLIALHRAGRLPLERLVTTFPLERINDAVAAAHDGGVVKPVLVMP